MTDGSCPPSEPGPDFTRFSWVELGECYRYGETQELRRGAQLEMDRRRIAKWNAERAVEKDRAYAEEVNGPPSHRMKLVTRRVAAQDRKKKKPAPKARPLPFDGRAAAAGKDD